MMVRPANVMMAPDEALSSVASRLETKSRREGTCLIWTGYVNPVNGYGQIGISKALIGVMAPCRSAYTHLAACFLAHGPKPEGRNVEVLHSCDRKTCIEPSHLSWGTRQQNTRDAYRRGLIPTGERSRFYKLTDEEAHEVIHLAREGVPVSALAEEFGVSTALIHKWLRGKGRVRRICPVTEACRDAFAKGE